jgi:hypothetical protein
LVQKACGVLPLLQAGLKIVENASLWENTAVVDHGPILGMITIKKGYFAPFLCKKCNLMIDFWFKIHCFRIAELLGQKFEKNFPYILLSTLQSVLQSTQPPTKTDPFSIFLEGGGAKKF